MNIKKYVSTAVVMTGIMMVPILASAQTTQTGQTMPPNAGAHYGNGGMRGGMMGGQGQHGQFGQPGVFGTVSAVSGTSLTVSGKTGFGSTTTATTYTVDASKATVMKNNATSSVSVIAVGDTVMVRGTVSGTNVTATMIRDGVPTGIGAGAGAGMWGQGQGGRGMGTGSSTRQMPASPITGNGQPVIAGTVSSINSSSIVVTNKSNVTYTVDTTNAKIVEGQTAVTISSVAVGDNVIVQGVVSGTNVTASSVIDQKAMGQGGNMGQGNQGSSTGSQSHPQAPRGGGGVFGAIGSFFSHLFGF